MKNTEEISNWQALIAEIFRIYPPILMRSM